MNTRYVRFEDVIGHLAMDYGWPLLKFEDLVLLGQRAVKVYGLEGKYKTITFEVMCYYITLYINTPFGKKTLMDLI